MDSITHIALGACLGEAFLGKEIGKRAMIWGALAQSIPDIDFIAASWMSTPDALLAHRGFTHSFLFAALLTPMFALLADRWHRPHNVTMRTWNIFFAVSIFGHLIIDGFNNYGVGWFEPFSHVRISFNSVYVADPFFSIWPGLALLGLLAFNRQNRNRKAWVRIGLLLPALYLIYTIFNKINIERDLKKIAASEHIHVTDYFTTPAPLSNWLWFVVVKSDSGYYTGYRSVWDRKPAINFSYFPQNRSMLDTLSDHEALQRLIRFSRNFYTVESWHDTLVLNNLQFGQMIGWNNPRAQFVFHYFLSHPNDNKLVVQRGRMAGWNADATRTLLKRSLGN